MTSLDDGPYVELSLRRIVIRDAYDSQMIYLSERDGERSFAISIGRGEAEEIRRVARRQTTERPLTHQLLLEVVRELGGELVRVDINDLRKNTFFARLVVRAGEGGQERAIDARSSDAIALALRAGCPIRVAESVLQQVRLDLGPDALPAQATAPGLAVPQAEDEVDAEEEEEVDVDLDALEADLEDEEDELEDEELDEEPDQEGDEEERP